MNEFRGKCNCVVPSPKIDRIVFSRQTSAIRLYCRRCGRVIAWYSGTTPIETVISHNVGKGGATA